MAQASPQADSVLICRAVLFKSKPPPIRNLSSHSILRGTLYGSRRGPFFWYVIFVEHAHTQRGILCT